MKKLILLLPICFILCSCGETAEELDVGVKGLKWKMNQEEVSEIIGVSGANNNDEITVMDMGIDFPISVISTRSSPEATYYFHNNKLYEVQYRVENSGTDETKYNEIVFKLSESYGEPYLPDPTDDSNIGFKMRGAAWNIGDNGTTLFIFWSQLNMTKSNTIDMKFTNDDLKAKIGAD